MPRPLNNSPAANGSLDDALIEQIVSEVVRRLSQTQPTDAATSETTVHCEHRIEKKLITVDTLRELPPNTTRLFAPTRIVITPAAIDELKRQGVALIRDCDGSQRPQPTLSHSLRGSTNSRSFAREQLLIGRVDAAAGPGWDGACVFGNATITGGLTSVLARIKQSLPAAGRGLLVTSAPAVAVYYACREGLRAVYGSDTAEILEAQQQFDANLLVIDSNKNHNGVLESFVNSNR